MLTVGAEFDRMPFDADSSGVDDDETVAMQLVSSLHRPPDRSCWHAPITGVGDVQARYAKITAVQVAQLTNTLF